MHPETRREMRDRRKHPENPPRHQPPAYRSGERPQWRTRTHRLRAGSDDRGGSRNGRCRVWRAEGGSAARSIVPAEAGQRCPPPPGLLAQCPGRLERRTVAHHQWPGGQSGTLAAHPSVVALTASPDVMGRGYHYAVPAGVTTMCEKYPFVPEPIQSPIFPRDAPDLRSSITRQGCSASFTNRRACRPLTTTRRCVHAPAERSTYDSY